MSSRYKAKLVVKLFPSIPKAGFGGARFTAWLDRHLFYREFQVSPWKAGVAAFLAVSLALWAVVALVLAGSALLRAETMRREVESREADLAEARVRLNSAKRDYYLLLSRLSPLNQHVDRLSQFAGNLATVAGIPDLAAELSAPLDQRRQDMTLTAREVEELDRRFDRLGTFVESQASSLQRTPSISPVATGFLVTDRYGFRVSRFTRQEGEGTGGADREFHSGLDLACPVGTPIRATADGTVHFAGRVPVKDNPRAALYGNFVVLDHGNGIRTIYAHCDQLNVAADQPIRRGQVIAWVGSTGRSTGPHCHYEVVVGGRPIDPELFILDAAMPERRLHVDAEDRSLLSDEVDRLLGH